MLMLDHASVIVVPMRATHRAIHQLRFGDLRRQGEREDCSDNARDADAVADHVPKLQAVVPEGVGETPLTGEGTPGSSDYHF